MPLHLDPADPEAIARYLRERAWLPPHADITAIEPGGEGNMNLVLRVGFSSAGSQRTLILKQSRPWVEKYPQIEAPEQRLLVEIDFYRAAATVPEVAARLPDLRHVDSERRIAAFEDLGTAADYTDLYAGEPLPEADDCALLGWLSALHRSRLEPDDWPELRNRAMRALNHAHIFVIPFEADNGVDLEAILPGLEPVAARVRADRALRDAVLTLGERYLADGTALLHGDYYPGSWLATADGPYIIDAEFAFFGPPEFDVGVYLAHRLLADAPPATARASLAHYITPTGFTLDLAWRFAGIEVLRRLLGVAQLPLAANLKARTRLLELARSLVLDANPETTP